MPTVTPQGASQTLLGPHRVRGTLTSEPGHVVMTADLGLVPTRREERATVQPKPARIPLTSAPAERRPPTTRECGLGEEEDTTGGTRCCGIMPELMIELI